MSAFAFIWNSSPCSFLCSIERTALDVSTSGGADDAGRKPGQSTNTNTNANTNDANTNTNDANTNANTNANPEKGTEPLTELLQRANRSMEKMSIGRMRSMALVLVRQLVEARLENTKIRERATRLEEDVTKLRKMLNISTGSRY